MLDTFSWNRVQVFNLGRFHCNLYMQKSAPTHSLIHSLTQHGSRDSMEDRVTNFGVQIGFAAPNPPTLPRWQASKTRFLG